jgi:hypothetical protein
MKLVSGFRSCPVGRIVEIDLPVEFKAEPHEPA